MKEVTHEDWLKNPTPRMMWVWDTDENYKKQRKVIYISEPGIPYPVFALTDDKLNTEHFRHCAEIEETKTRRMTNKELSRWVREKPTREWKYTVDSRIYSNYNYEEDDADIDCWNEIVVREDDGEWREPLVADHYKD